MNQDISLERVTFKAILKFRGNCTCVQHISLSYFGDVLKQQQILESERYIFEFFSDINLISLSLSFLLGEIALVFSIFRDACTD